MSWFPRLTGLGPRETPTVGVFAALNEAEDDMEEELSARAKGAGGGLELEVTGGLNGLGISLIPPSFPVGNFGLEAGLGGGTKVPTERGVVGLAEEDDDIVEVEEEEEESPEFLKSGSHARRSLFPFSLDEAESFDFVNSSLDEFRFINAGLCLDIAGESVIFPIDSFNSSNEGIV